MPFSHLSDICGCVCVCVCVCVCKVPLCKADIVFAYTTCVSTSLCVRVCPCLCVCVCCGRVQSQSSDSSTHLLLGLAVLPLAGLLLDVRCHGEGGAVVAVGQVDDVGDGRQHGALAAGADEGVTLAHGQQELDGRTDGQTDRQVWDN